MIERALPFDGIDNFRDLITHYANPSSGERDLWLTFVDICTGEIDNEIVERILSNSKIPIYYKTLLLRRVRMLADK